MEGLVEFAASIPDFRRTNKGNIRHKLSDIILLMIMARLSGCTGRTEIIEFGKYNLKRFQSMGMLERGVPSEPTLCRVEQGIDENGLSISMSEMMMRFYGELTRNKAYADIICIDGKAMRGTLQRNGRNPDIVSAYSSSQGITLATEACEEKSNEITAVPALLDKIDIAGKVITADAMSFQKTIIDKIREKGGEFIIELKANQPSLRYGIEDGIEGLVPESVTTIGPELGHGRIETRTYRAYDGLELIHDKRKWGGNLTVVVFESRTTIKSSGVTISDRRFYVSSLPPCAPNLAPAIRTHWCIESMHWGLDTILRQDSTKRKSVKAARNLDTLQRIVHGLFSIWKAKRKKLADKAKGITEIMRNISMSFTRLMRFLTQK